MENSSSFWVRFYKNYERLVEGIYHIYETIVNIPLIFKNINITIKYMYEIGVETFPLVVFTSIFVGIITALQANYQFDDLVPKIFLGTAILKAIVTELAPVIMALVMSSRYASATAAELGTMAVSEQINAMIVLGLNPIRFLFTPRIVAGIIMFPVITILSDVFSYLGAMATSVFFLNVPAYIFIEGSKKFFFVFDVVVGLIKAAVFGFIVTYVGCIFGYMTKNGAKGVGESTMNAVVWADILILIFDFIVAWLLF